MGSEFDIFGELRGQGEFDLFLEEEQQQQRAEDLRKSLVKPEPVEDPVEHLRKVRHRDQAIQTIDRIQRGEEIGPAKVAEQYNQAVTGKKRDIATEREALDAISNNPDLNDFYARHPEAAMMAPKDAPLFARIAATTREVAESIVDNPIVSGFKKDEIATEQADVAGNFKYFNAQRGSPEFEKSRAEWRALQKRASEIGTNPDPFTLEYRLESIGQFGNQMQDLLYATGTNALTGAVAAGLAGGATLGEPGVIAGVPAGAAVGGAYGSLSQMYHREFGATLGYLLFSGEFDDVPEWRLTAAAHAYAIAATAIEAYSTSIGMKLIAPAAVRAAKSALGMKVREMARSEAGTATLLAILKRVGAAGAVEAGEEFSQAIAEQLAVGSIVKGHVEFDPEDAAAQADAAFWSGLLFGGVGAGLSYRSLRAKISDSIGAEKLFDAMAEGASGSELKKYSPRHYREFQHQLTGESIPYVYVEPEQFELALSQAQMTVADAEKQMPGITKKITDAKETGRDVAIPTADFAANVATNDQLFNKVRSKVKLKEDGLSNEQRIRAIEDLKAGRPVESIENFDTDLDRAVGVWSEQMEASGRMDNKQVEDNAGLVRAVIGTRAIQLGITPTQLMEKFPVTIAGPTDTRQTRTGTVSYDQRTGRLNEDEDLKKAISGTAVVQEDGRPMRVFHTTRNEYDVDDAFPFMHFGTAKAAEDRVTLKMSGKVAPGGRTLGAYLDIKKPLRMVDHGVHNPWTILNELKYGNELRSMQAAQRIEFKDFALTIGDEYPIDRDAVSEAMKQVNELEAGADMFGASPQAKIRAQYEVLANLLESHGYDGIEYMNAAEDAGSISYIAPRSSQIIPIAQARAQDAQFFPQRVPKLDASPMTTEAKAAPTPGMALAKSWSAAKNGVEVRAQQREQLNKIAEAHPDPLASEESWFQFFHDVTGIEDQSLIPPARAIEWVNDPQQAVDFINKLSPAQRDSALEGLETAKRIGEAFKRGDLDASDFGMIIAWAALSKQLTSSVHEAGFLRAMNNGLREFVDIAVSGTWTKADTKRGLKWTADLFQTGSGLPVQAKANLNALFKQTLPTFSSATYNNKPLIRALADMLKEDAPTRDIRAALLSEAVGGGLQQKVTSFALLVSGRTDVLVLDRWQARSYWASDYTENTNVEIKNDKGATRSVPLASAIYDSVPTGRENGNGTITTGLAAMLEGPSGLGLLEGIERSLTRVADVVYGEPDLGRFHWESWLLVNDQEVGHASLDAILNKSTEGARVREGRDYLPTRGRLKSYGDIFAIEGGEEVYYVKGLGDEYARFNTEEWNALPRVRDHRRIQAQARIHAARGEGAVADRLRPGNPIRNAAVRLARGIRAAAQGNRGRDQGAVPDAYRRGSEGVRLLRVGESEVMGSLLTPITTKDVIAPLSDAGVDMYNFVELEQSDANAAMFHRTITRAKDMLKFGASVYAYPEEAYREMRLFMNQEGTVGFALKDDGDIVSAFSTSTDIRSAATALLELAVQEGGRKLDAFDTVLPYIYADSGFKAVARVEWDDSQAPSDWDKNTFSAFNDGEPGVVFMVFDPANNTGYDPSSVPVVDYETALRMQAQAVADMEASGPREFSYSQPAYHGTGASPFERFLMRFMSSGEGSQYRGWGMYFAQLRDVAARYRAGAIAKMDSAIRLSWGGTSFESRLGPLGNANIILKYENGTNTRDDVIQFILSSAASELYYDRDGADLSALLAEERENALDASLKQWADIQKVQLHRKVYEGDADFGDTLTPVREGDASVSYYNFNNDVVRVIDEMLSDGASEIQVEDVVPDTKPHIAKVDIPEMEELLWFDKPFSEMQPRIKEKLMSIRLPDGTPFVTDKSLSEAAKEWNASGTIRQFLDTGLAPELYMKNDDYTGQQLYYALAERLGTENIFGIDEEVWNAARSGSDVNASHVLLKAGIPGHRFEDAGTRKGFSKNEGPSYIFVIYDEDAIKILAHEFNAPGERGRITFNERDAIIRLLEASDGTTFGHELAHWYLQQTRWLIEDGQATEEIRADMDRIMQWLGITDLSQLDQPYADGRTHQGQPDIPHEVFARGFEAYLSTGQAPTPEMQGSFARFREWAAAAYGGVKQIARQLGVEITPEAREIYDRMLVLDEAIETVDPDPGPLFLSAQEMAGTDDDYAAYLAKRDAALAAARAKLAKRFIGQFRKEQREKRRALRDRIRAEIELEHMADPAHRAIRWLKRGDDPEIRAVTNIGLDRDSVIALVGERAVELLNSIPGGRQGWVVAGATQEGLDPEDVAGLFGFGSGRQLVEAMLAAVPYEEAVTRRLNERMAEADPMTDENVEEAAHRAVWTLDRETILRAELQALRESLGATLREDAEHAVDADPGRDLADISSDLGAAKRDANAEGVVLHEAERNAARARQRQTRAVLRKIAEAEARMKSGEMKRRAVELVSGIRAGDLQRERRGWMHVSQREAKEARRAVAARDVVGAVAAIERQLLAHHAAAYATDVLRQLDREQKNASKFYKPKEANKLRRGGYDGAAVITGLIERFNFRKGARSLESTLGRKGKELIRRAKKDQYDAAAAGLLDFAEKAAKDGWIVDFDSFFANPPDGVTSWRDLEVAHLLGLFATIRNVERIARGEVKQYDKLRALNFAKRDAAMADRIRSLWDKRHKAMLDSDRRRFESIVEYAETFDATLLKREDLIDFLGGEDIEDNPLREWLWDPVEIANQEEIEYQLKIGKRMREVMKEADWKRWRKKVRVPGLDRDMYLYEVIAIGLNRGNESNWNKLVKGYESHPDFRWKEAQLEKALTILSDQDWDTIQEMWNVLAELQPLLWQNHFDLTGEQPKKVEPRPFVTPTGRVLEGGYYPVAYDPSPLMSQRSAVLAELNDTRGLLGGRYASADTEHGYMTARKEGYAAPISLNLRAMSRHVNDAIHDLTHRRAVIQVYTQLQQPLFRKAVQETWGDAYLESLDQWIRSIAGSRPESTKNYRRFEAVGRWSRSAVTAMGLGFRVSTAIVQPLGLFNTLGEIGPQYVLRELARSGAGFLPSRYRFAMKKSRFMRQRMGNNDRDIRAELQKISDDEWVQKEGKIRRAALWHIAAADMWVSTVSWNAAFNKSIAEGKTEAQAVRFADRVVRRSQGSGFAKDLSQFQQGGEWYKEFSMFYSYGSALYAQQRRVILLAGKNRVGQNQNLPLAKRDLPRAFGRWTASFFLPTAVQMLISGDEPEDEEKWLKWVATNGVATIATPVPILRDIVPLITRSGYGVQGTPVTRAVEPFINLAYQLTDEDVDAQKAARASLQAVGYARRLPLGQAELWLDNFWYGFEDMEWRDLIYRKPVARRD